MVVIALGGLAEQEVPQSGGGVCLRARKSRKGKKGQERARKGKKEQKEKIFTNYSLLITN